MNEDGRLRELLCPAQLEVEYGLQEYSLFPKRLRSAEIQVGSATEVVLRR